jgi:hypothetical protein
MRALPPKMVQVLAPFAPLFSTRVFRHAQVLLIGAILAPGARTDGQFRPACDGLGPGETLPPLPPRAQPCQLVESGGQSRAVGVAGGGVLVPEGGKGVPCSWASTRPSRDATGRRSRPGASTAIRSVPPTKTS